MEDAVDGRVTVYLKNLGEGGDRVFDALMRSAYQELRRIAVSRMRCESKQHTLQPTALVHEVWLKISGCKSLPMWRTREHFFAWASRVMVNCLIDHARRKKRKKRGGQRERTPLHEVQARACADPTHDMVEARDAIDALAAHDARRALILRLDTFSLLNTAEIAAAVGLSEAAVQRSLRASRVWLAAELAP